MTTVITIRNVPRQVRDELAARAARSGRSLQEFVLGELVALTAVPDSAEVLQRARLRARGAGSEVTSGDILAARDVARDAPRDAAQGAARGDAGGIP